MINILQDNKQSCCGCNACANICPKKCITMIEDEEGFKYPQVDKSVCINCNLCEKVCPILQKSRYYEEKKDSSPRAIGGWHKNDEVRYDSSSGGAFTLFAEHVLAAGGIVYGCALKDDFSPEHVGITRIDELTKLRGSKYVQSDTAEVYKEIKSNLVNNRMVLFVGTPCQCAGLHGYLGTNYANLYVIDFICHGVPSPKVFADYIKYLEKKYHDKVTYFRFRNKDTAWKPTGMQMGTKVGFQKSEDKRFAPAYRDSYMNGFLDDVYLRPSCYSCEFKCLPKYYVDFTIADFWGVNNVDKELDDGKGTSLILIHNKHGEEFFDKVKENFVYKEVEFEKAIRRNQSLIKSVAENPNRDSFFEEYACEPFEKIEKKYMSAWKWASHKAMKIGWSIIEKIIRAILSPILKIFHQNWSETQWKTFLQFVKFAMVGVTNVVVSYLINISTLLLLRNLNLAYDYVIANISAFLLSVLWSFYWNNRFVFSSKKDKGKVGELIRTYISYGFTGIILNNVLAVLWIEVLHISKFISPLLNLPITVPINFFMQKIWVYKEKRDKI